MMLESSRYDKWGDPRGGGGSGAWAGRERDRERERERERQARAHQMPNATELIPELFQAPIRVVGNKDRTSQQIQNKLGDYHIAQTLLDDPSKSIGICAEPPSPAPCHPSRRESEFKKPSQAPQNGRIPHRPYYKNEVAGSTSGSGHRPPPLRISNGYQHQNVIDSSQPPIESILKEMISLPTPLSVMAATPRKELENKFIYDPTTNKVQENPQPSIVDLKTPITKPGLDNRISNSRISVSPDVVGKDLGLSESDDEAAAAAATGLHPIISPLGSGGSPSSDSESSRSDSDSESSSTESSTAPQPAPPPPPPPPPRRQSPETVSSVQSWGLVNFAPPSAHPPAPDRAEMADATPDAKGKSPSSEQFDSSSSSPSPARRRRRSPAKQTSPATSEEDEPRMKRESTSPGRAPPAKRGRPPRPPAPAARLRAAEPGAGAGSGEEPAKKRRGRPPKPRAGGSVPAESREPPVVHDMKTHIFRKVFTPRKGDEGGGKGGKGGKGKGGKGKGQVTIIEVTAPETDDDRHREPRKTDEVPWPVAARLSPQPEEARRREKSHRRSPDRTGLSSERIPIDRLSTPTDRLSANRLSTPNERFSTPTTDRLSGLSDRSDRLDRLDRLGERLPSDRYVKAEADVGSAIPKSDRGSERLSEASSNGLSSERIPIDRMSTTPNDRLSTPTDRLSGLSDRSDRSDRLSGDKLDRLGERLASDRYVKAEADVGSGIIKSERGSERLSEASSNGSERRRLGRLLVQIPLSKLRADIVRGLQPGQRAVPAAKRDPAPQGDQGGEVAATNHERTAEGQTPLYSYFERETLADEERHHKYYLDEASRLRSAAEREQEPLQRVMLYLESVLCFVLTGRVLELELDTKRAFTIYRETIEYIKLIHAMPQRFRASPHSTFNKLDILSLRVQSLLYLRMFKMYNREVKEYHKIVQEYQQKVSGNVNPLQEFPGKPACPESVSPLSPTPSPAGSVGSVGSGSHSSGYCSLVHSVPAHAHNALLQLTKYYTFLYVAHDLWDHSDTLCRQPPNQELFKAVDRKCGPLSLFSTFLQLVRYVRHAISLLKQQPARE